MDDEVAEDLVRKAQELAASIDSCKETLAPLLSGNHETFDSAMSQLEPLDRAQMYITLAYAINTLFFTYLRTQGATKGHPSRKELGRVKDYMEKWEKVKSSAQKPSMRVDKQAAGRFIKHGLHIAKQDAQQNKESAATEAESFLAQVLPADGTSLSTKENAEESQATPSAKTKKPAATQPNAVKAGGKAKAAGVKVQSSIASKKKRAAEASVQPKAKAQKKGK
ncbi:hypothetical protein HDU96_005467 [Phlyctochytrium bullatum]|nr:hypothetical protein HDU96_005467 [Phlyctochytrium bullatum]